MKQCIILSKYFRRVYVYYCCSPLKLVSKETEGQYPKVCGLMPFGKQNCFALFLCGFCYILHYIHCDGNHFHHIFGTCPFIDAVFCLLSTEYAWTSA